MKRSVLPIVFMLLFSAASAQKPEGFEIVERTEKKQVDILWNGNLLTAYCYYDSIRKPFLFPVKSIDGITVTRGWPIDPKAGERTDHPHHNGIWMNYESVNGLDFWNNSTAIPPERRHLYGTIRHDGIIEKKEGKENARVIVTASWLGPDGHRLLKETTNFSFSVKDSTFFIERISSLTAGNDPVVFRDVKDGFLAIRVARELEMPSQQADVFVDMHGNKTAVPKSVNNKGVTGKYYSSEGITGDSVWGTKGRWAMLQGLKDRSDITIGIVDHPSNAGYPSYWHARGYGLFAINPLGRKIFSNGKEELNLTIPPNGNVTFRYLVLISSGKKLTPKDMDKVANDFVK